MASSAVVLRTDVSPLDEPWLLPLPKLAAAPIRCRGVTRQGVQCRWTAACDSPVAAPLAEGEHFCYWHGRRSKKKAVVPDETQLRLDQFSIQPPLPLADCVAGASDRAASSALPLPIADGTTSDTGVIVASAGERGRALAQSSSSSRSLSAEQLARIAENRRLALERRQQRGAANASSGTVPDRSTASETADAKDPGAPLQLTQAQLALIEQKRLEALKRRRRRSSAAAPTTADSAADAAPTAGDVSASAAAPVSTVAPAAAPAALDQAQLARIERNRREALERRKRRQLLLQASDPSQVADPASQSVASSPPPSQLLSQADATPAEIPVVLAGRDAEATVDTPAAANRTRSRTPPKRPPRRLIPRMTASPLPRPPRTALAGTGAAPAKSSSSAPGARRFSRLLRSAEGTCADLSSAAPEAVGDMPRLGASGAI
eukprot:TRINITY_DN25154_c0_g1_i1.p1 TRINITY_DN25154_c0_g1~~TRINITY_DN25154_c0_g1_i1.p1  ORF type:complete len:434 (+),score=80.84 TRINITY_DN25154_c0_g1_i1:104-1405(+)